MTLLARTTTIDTWPEMERTAGERFWDGLTLAISADHRGTGAIYLLGYVAEILIKSAYYRVSGVDALADVGPELRGMAARARALGFQWQGNRHNLESLVRLLVEEHRERQRPLDPVLAGQIRVHALSVGAHWSEILRYKNVIANDDEIEEVYHSVEWLRSHYELFRS